MSVFGLLILEAVGFPKIESAGDWGREKYYAVIASISCIVWISAYHLWIKQGTRLRDKLMLAIGVPFVGTFLAGFIFGVIMFFVFFGVFFPISLITVSLLAVVARNHPTQQ